MDYKKKYEQALERCKEEFNFKNLAYSHEEIKQKLKRVFPELEESEDDEIRHYLIEFVKINDGVNLPPDYAKKALAWLEKQDPNRLEKEIELAYKTADDVQYRKGFEAGVASVKPAEWSEEDEEIFDSIIANMYFTQKAHPLEVNQVVYERDIDWLKSLKRRMKGE